MNKISCKRIYEPYEEIDGFRILVDRLWPRGIKKENTKIDLWAKEIAPSKELRQWFSHIPERYDAFKERYRKELSANPTSEEIRSLCQQKIQDNTITLLYSAKNEQCNHALVLKEWLMEQMRG